jgi:hypothetical protein
MAVQLPAYAIEDKKVKDVSNDVRIQMHSFIVF